MCGQMQVDAGWAIDRAHDALVKRSDVVDDLPNIVSGRSPPIFSSKQYEQDAEDKKWFRWGWQSTWIAPVTTSIIG